METQQPPHASASTTAHGGAVENLKSLMIKCAIASAPAKSLSPEHYKRIQELVPTIHTPHHPTYQWVSFSLHYICLCCDFWFQACIVDDILSISELIVDSVKL